MTEKRYSNLDVWEMGAENTAKILNELNDENQELKRLIKKMGELGGFNKHLIKTICEDSE